MGRSNGRPSAATEPCALRFFVVVNEPRLQKLGDGAAHAPAFMQPHERRGHGGCTRPAGSGVDEIEIPAFLRKPAGCCRLAGAGVLGWPPDGKARARP